MTKDLVKQRVSERLERLLSEQNLQRNELAQLVGVSDQAVTNWIKRGQISKSSVSVISEKLGYSPEWLLGLSQDNAMSLATIGDNEPRDGDIVIDVLNVEASAENGCVASDLVEVISEIHYRPDRYFELFKGFNPKNIKIISVKGDSMLPTIKPNALLYVDVGVTYFDGDGIYVFTYDDTIFVKRLQKLGKKLRVISDNRVYESWDIDPNEDIYIHARVRAHQGQEIELV